MDQRDVTIENPAPGRGSRGDAASRGEQAFEGIGVAPGIAIGPVYLYARDAFVIEQRELEAEAVEEEVERFEQAVQKAERELRKIADVAREKLGDESAGIFEAQALMLRDEALYEAVVERIRRDRCNADYAVQSVMKKHSRLMEASASEYLRERANDLFDVQERIIRRLRRGKILSRIDPNVIVVAENLTAADIILFSRRHVLGCAMDYGGPTSHVSLMARSLNLPAVVSMHGITQQAQTGDMMILDGLHGRVILNPEPKTLAVYQTKQERYQRFLQEQKHLVPLPAETLDGHSVTLRANLEFREELKLLDEYGAEGIGLFRTEILFLMQGRFSISEEEQFKLYQKIVRSVGEPGTTFRVLDLGGDKMLPMGHREQNPFLGWRGVRVLLDKHELLLPQMRAILRASAFGKVRILLPMVTNIEEVHRFKEVLEEVKASLRAEQVAFDEHIEIGVMVEVPAVALMADQFAPEVDFFSIGTNDLTQYTLAVDRGNDLVADKFQELHPALLTLIQRTIQAAHQNGIPVSVCGELAADPRATCLLVGFGIDELSMSPAYLPEVKRVIRAMKVSEGQDLAAAALEAASAQAVLDLVEQWLGSHACDVARFFQDTRDDGGETEDEAEQVDTEPQQIGL